MSEQHDPEESFDKLLDTVLSLLIGDIRIERIEGAPKLRVFDGAWVFLRELMAGWDRFGGPDILIPAKGRLEVLAVPLDISCVVNVDGEPGEPETQPGLVFERFRRVFPRDVRGRARIICPEMIRLTLGVWVPSSPILDSFIRDFVLGQINGTWRYIGQEFPGCLREDETARVGLAVGLASAVDAVWSVRLGQPGGLSLRFPTDPRGALAIFRDRERWPGEARRAALKHWVNEHMRRKRADDAEATIRVVRHLRGAEHFFWNGLDCWLSPSPADLRLAASEKGRRRLTMGEWLSRTLAQEETNMDTWRQRAENFWGQISLLPARMHWLRRLWWRLRTRLSD